MASAMKEMFPDLSMSVIVSVEQESQNTEEAVATLQQLSSTEPSDSRKEAIFQEILLSFGREYEQLGRTKIFNILKQHGWDVELALVPLFEALLDFQKNKTAHEANHILGDLVQGIDKDVIRQVFEKHDGDADQAAEELLERFGHKNEETPEQRKKREQRDMISAIQARFGLSENEAREALEIAHWIPQDACVVVQRRRKEKRIDQLKEEFPALSRDQIRSNLRPDEAETRAALQALLGNNPPAPAPAPPQEDIRVEAAKDADAMREFVAAQDPRALAKFRLAATIRIDGPENDLPQQDLERTQKAVPVEGSDACGMVVNTVRLRVPKVVSLGQPFTVGVVNPDVDLTQTKTNTNDWIGMYFEGSSEPYYRTYQWLYHGYEATFTAPSTCCKIFFRYFSDKTYKASGTSDIVHVGPQLKLTPTVVSSSELQVKVDKISGGNLPNLWVGLYHHNQRNLVKSPLAWDWFSNAKDGCITFKVPKAGTYTLRGFPDRGHDFAEELNVNVEGQDQLILSFGDNGNVIVKYSFRTVDPSTDKVWVGIYRADEPNNCQYQRYKRVSSSSGVLEMKPLDHAGSYEARYFACGTYDLIGRSPVAAYLK